MKDFRSFSAGVLALLRGICHLLRILRPAANITAQTFLRPGTHFRAGGWIVTLKSAAAFLLDLGAYVLAFLLVKLDLDFVARINLL